MNFKNYLKISFANFDKTWKLVFYRVIVWLFVIALIAPCYNILKELILSVWNDDLFINFASAGMFYGKNVAPVFAVIFVIILSLVETLFVSYTAVGVYLAIILFLIKPMLMSIGRYVVNEMMYGFMSSYTKMGFASTFVKTLKKSIGYAFFRTLFCLPFNFLTLFVFYLLLTISNEAFIIVMPIVFIVCATFILALKLIMILGWAPAMIVYGENVYKGFGIGIKATFRGFGRSTIFALCIYFFSLLLAFGFGIFSLIIIVPTVSITASIFETMNFFDCQGMRYYLDKDTILSSKKLEEQDTITKAKFLL